MEKTYKLNKAPYGKINAVRTRIEFSRIKGGYAITAEFIEQMEGGCFGKLFSGEYYQHNGDGYYLIIPCERKGSKRQREAEKIFEEKSRDAAETFVKHVNSKLDTDIEITEEA